MAKKAAKNWSGKISDLINSDDYEVRIWLPIDSSAGLNLKSAVIKIFKATSNRIACHRSDFSATYSLPLSNLIMQVRPINKEEDDFNG